MSEVSNSQTPQQAGTDQPPVLAIDVGGSHVKVMHSVLQKKRRFTSGPHLSAKDMCRQVIELTRDLEYGRVSIGIPCPVRNDAPIGEPPNLGTGWVGFDYAGTFGMPVRILNDAAMQALGSYRKGRMLFLGLGTGLGTALVTRREVIALELGHLPYREKKSFEDYVGEAGLHRLGKARWRKHVGRVIGILQAALLPDETVIGGGNVHLLKELPEHCRRGDNKNAFLGGFRLWSDDY